MGTNSPIAVGVMGAAGRMGVQVCDILKFLPGVKLHAAIEIEDHPAIGQPISESELRYTTAQEALLTDCEVLISFTTAEGIEASAACAKQHGLALVIGATGMKAAHEDCLRDLSRVVPVLQSANMSLGVNLLFHLTRQAGRILQHWDAEVLDLHHGGKLDAPSGTATELAKILQDVRDGDELCTDRISRQQARPTAEIGVAALRGGDVVGEHTVYLLGAGERLELTHRATHRRNFAAGAVYAAKFIHGKPAGSYTMDDVLELKSLD